jgi:predicted RNA binding protein YcfA (HicA-like mRNA interferase family)
MCRILETNGWLLKRIKGSHHIYAKQGERKVTTVPVYPGEKHPIR